MSRPYLATLHAVQGHGAPPTSFLDVLVRTLKSLPDSVFAADLNHDIYSVLAPVLGPWQGLGHRRAVMAEALRVLAGYESNWKWTEGADTTAGHEAPDEVEAGAFQVSANSLHFDASLVECVDAAAGCHDPETFCTAMKTKPELAVEYCARLLRYSTRWDGPINRGWVAQAVWPPAVAEFELLLSPL